MKLEGIPSSMEHCHHHDVTIDITIGERTTKNVVNIVKAAGAVASAVLVVKSIMHIAETGAVH